MYSQGEGKLLMTAVFRNLALESCWVLYVVCVVVCVHVDVQHIFFSSLPEPLLLLRDFCRVKSTSNPTSCRRVCLCLPLCTKKCFTNFGLLPWPVVYHQQVPNQWMVFTVRTKRTGNKNDGEKVSWCASQWTEVLHSMCTNMNQDAAISGFDCVPCRILTTCRGSWSQL